MMIIPRIRRINDVIKEMKEKDPETEVSWEMIKTLIKTGKITTKKFGNSWLINLDEFYSFFTKGDRNENTINNRGDL